MNAALLAVLSTVLVTSSAAQAAEEEVRIVARRLEDGRVEFGLQQRQADDSWGDRQLPRARLFPTDATIGHWLVSSPVSLNNTDSPGDRSSGSDPNDDSEERVAEQQNVDPDPDPPDCSDAPDGATCNSNEEGNEEGTAWFFSPGPWDGPDSLNLEDSQNPG